MKPIKLNKRHKGSTIVNVSNNITLKIQYTDLRKKQDNYETPIPFIYFKSYIVYNIFIVVNNKKQKKNVRNNYYNDHVGKGDVKDLLKVKDIILQLSKQLNNNEIIKINGSDKRRYKIYKYFLEKDIRFSCNMYYSETDLWIINTFSLLQQYQWNIIKDKNGKYNKRELRKAEKEWEEFLI